MLREIDVEQNMHTIYIIVDNNAVLIDIIVVDNECKIL